MLCQPIRISNTPYEFVARSAYRAMFFEGDEDCGVASQEFTDALMLIDDTKNWPSNYWVGGYVLIVEGPGAGEIKLITSSDDVSILVSPAFTVKPTEKSRYVLVQNSKMWVYPVGEAAITCPRKILGDDAYKSHQRDCQVKINSIKSSLSSGLNSPDYVRIPALFQNIDPTFAHMPGMVNMLVIGNRAIIAKPFGPWDNGMDVFEYDVSEKLYDIGIWVNFVDDWNTYHSGEGEIHCGTNVKRTPHNTNWWEH